MLFEEIAAVNFPEEIRTKLLSYLLEKGYIADTSLGYVETKKGRSVGITGKLKTTNEHSKWILMFPDDFFEALRNDIKAERALFNMPEGRSKLRKFFRDDDKYGKYCYCSRYSDFVSFDQDSWLEKMCKNFKECCEEEPSSSQIAAWTNCRSVLTSTFDSLPESFRDTWLVFEYALPRNKPGTKKEDKMLCVRPDVLLISGDRIIVMEFKQREPDKDGNIYEGLVSQAQKYKARLEKFHLMSHDMIIFNVLVLTHGNYYINVIEDSTYSCTSDRLPDLMQVLMHTASKNLTEDAVSAWLDSDIVFLTEEQENKLFPEPQDYSAQLLKTKAALNTAAAKHIDAVYDMIIHGDRQEKRILNFVFYSSGICSMKLIKESLFAIRDTTDPKKLLRLFNLSLFLLMHSDHYEGLARECIKKIHEIGKTDDLIEIRALRDFDAIHCILNDFRHYAGLESKRVIGKARKLTEYQFAEKRAKQAAEKAGIAARKAEREQRVAEHKERQGEAAQARQEALAAFAELDLENKLLTIASDKDHVPAYYDFDFDTLTDEDFARLNRSTLDLIASSYDKYNNKKWQRFRRRASGLLNTKEGE